ncbi:MAG: dynamin family protein [Caldilineaceae bacterium]
MQRLLTREQDELLRRERSLLEELRVHLSRLDATDDDLDLLKQSLKQLEEFFLLVVVGEFNAGKTAFLNALLGDRLLAEGVTPTTDRIHVLRHGENHRRHSFDDDILVLELPVEWLREINLVDTPGANAVIQRHQQITEHFVPRSDLVLFVTSADRPFSESERTFLERIRQWGKKIVIVVNKIDLIDEAGEREQILAFVRNNARQLLDVEPQIFAVSARKALRAKQQGIEQQSELWRGSQFAELERFLIETLDAKERLRLKLANPLGVAARLVQKYRDLIGGREQLLGDDYQTLDAIEEQLQEYQVDMRRDFKYHASHVDNVLYEMAERGDRFFDETLRVTNVMALVNGDKLRADFERVVVGDTSRHIEHQVNDLIDWLVDKDYQQWRGIMEFLNQRAVHHADRIVGKVQSDFEFNRQNLLASIGRNAQRVVDSYDREAESLKLAQEVQRALIQTAAVEAGALGLGALLVAILQTTLLDVTGVIGASALAAVGLYVLPYRRTKIKQQLREQINQLRAQLSEAMTRQFESELNDGLQRIREAMGPYSRFVRVEREKLAKLRGELDSGAAQISDMQHTLSQIQ